MSQRSQLHGGGWAPTPAYPTSSIQMSSPNPVWGTQFDSTLVERRNIRSDACYVEPITSDYTVPMESPTSQSGWEMQSRQAIADAAADEHHTEMARIEGEQGRSHAEYVAQSTASDSLTALESCLSDKQNVASVLHSVLGSLQEELQLQMADKNDVEHDLAHLTDSLRALDKCDKVRQDRSKNEMVRDGLEYALRKYERALSESSELLNQLINAYETEQSRLINARRRVVVDVEGKGGAPYHLEDLSQYLNERVYDHSQRKAGEAIRLDQACLATVAPTHDSPQVDHWKSKTMKYSWEQSANQILQEVSKTLQNAAKLRSKASVLRQEKASAEAEYLALACEALESKAQATKALKETAEFELAKIQEELDLTSQEHSKLQQAIAEKTVPLQLAEERLRTRNQRPQREKIRDHAEQALEREVQLLTQSVEELTRALQAVTRNLHKLEETRKTVVTDVESKSQALLVDIQCLQLIQEARGAK